MGPLFFFQSSREFLKAASLAHYYSSSHLWSSSRQCRGSIIIPPVISGVPQGSVLGPLLLFQSSLEFLNTVSWAHYSSSHLGSSSRRCRGPIIILPVISGVPQGSIMGHYYSSSHLWSSSRQYLGPIIILPAISGVPQGSVMDHYFSSSHVWSSSRQCHGPLLFVQSCLEFLKAVSWAHYYSSSHLWSSLRQCHGPLLFVQSCLEFLKAV